MELVAVQRSKEWHAARQTLYVTASECAALTGHDRFGTPWLFYENLVRTKPWLVQSVDGAGSSAPSASLPNAAAPDAGTHVNEFMRKGMEFEPVLREVYELLTGASTRIVGLYTFADQHPLHRLVGASPGT